MTRKAIHCENEICYQALQGMHLRSVHGASHDAAIHALALAALRRTSRRRGLCDHCPHRGQCAMVRTIDSNRKACSGDTVMTDARHPPLPL